MKSPMIRSVAMAATLVVGLSPLALALDCIGARQNADYLTGLGEKDGCSL
jgi:hypothetical protein